MRKARIRRHPRSDKYTTPHPADKQAVPKGRPLDEFRAELIARLAELRTPPTES